MNFDYMKNAPDFAQLYNYCSEAEEFAISRPNISVTAARKAMEYVVKLWKKRSMIIKWCCVGAVIGLMVGFSIPKTYKTGAVLAPETEQKMGSGVSSIASMMGVSLDNSVDAILMWYILHHLL